MAFYNVLFKRSAEKELRALPKNDLRKVVDKIKKLQSEPRTQGSELLTGQERLFRLRQGDYRIVYEIEDAQKQVTILKIGHRGEVYKH